MFSEAQVFFELLMKSISMKWLHAESTNVKLIEFSMSFFPCLFFSLCILVQFELAAGIKTDYVLMTLSPITMPAVLNPISLWNSFNPYVTVLTGWVRPDVIRHGVLHIRFIQSLHFFSPANQETRRLIVKQNYITEKLNWTNTEELKIAMNKLFYFISVHFPCCCFFSFNSQFVVVITLWSDPSHKMSVY